MHEISIISQVEENWRIQTKYIYVLQHQSSSLFVVFIDVEELCCIL